MKMFRFKFDQNHIKNYELDFLEGREKGGGGKKKTYISKFYAIIIG